MNDSNLRDEEQGQGGIETEVKDPAEGSANPEPEAEDVAPDYPSFTAGMDKKPEPDLAPDSGSMDLLRDVNLEVTVELGRTRMRIGELLELGQGSVIELEKMAGEPVDIRVNGVLMASGEVIVLDDVFGVRLTRLNNRLDRLSAFS